MLGSGRDAAATLGPMIARPRGRGPKLVGAGWASGRYLYALTLTLSHRNGRGDGERPAPVACGWCVPQIKVGRASNQGWACLQSRLIKVNQG